MRLRVQYARLAQFAELRSVSIPLDRANPKSKSDRRRLKGTNSNCKCCRLAPDRSLALLAELCGFCPLNQAFPAVRHFRLAGSEMSECETTTGPGRRYRERINIETLLYRTRTQGKSHVYYVAFCVASPAVSLYVPRVRSLTLFVASMLIQFAPTKTE